MTDHTNIKIYDQARAWKLWFNIISCFQPEGNIHHILEHYILAIAKTGITSGRIIKLQQLFGNDLDPIDHRGSS